MKTTVTRVGNPEAKSKDAVYIGRGSPFGNPFRIREDVTRSEVIAQFSVWFFNRMEKEADFRSKVHGLKGKTLVCHCKPFACHGDVIAGYLDNLQ